MISRVFQDKTLGQLGFGTMRLPTLADGSIDQQTLNRMVERALEGGINYFDTAWPYHANQSERAIGEALAAYPRDRFFLATKYPGHVIMSRYDPAEVFEAQLKKCRVEYFDFYLLHNVYERSIDTYADPQWGILEYFRLQKRLGRVRHLGFSCHGGLNTLEQFLDLAPDMEFCQIQLNYLDWTLQEAKEKVELLNARGIPVWVMEPVRGGGLAALPEEAERRLKALRPNESIPAWAFRFLQDLPGVDMILSGMSNMEQLEDNLRTFEAEKPLSAEERALLLDIAESLKDLIPCTGCRYCCDSCPLSLNIPFLLSAANEMRVLPSLNTGMRVEALPEEKRPAACIACGACAAACPQGIDIPAALAELAEGLAGLPSWAEISRQREEAERRDRERG